MDKIPERIYLKVYCDCEYCFGDFLADNNRDITWSETKVSSNDVEYVLASRVKGLEELIAAQADHINLMEQFRPGPKGWFLHPDNLPEDDNA